MGLKALTSFVSNRKLYESPHGVVKVHYRGEHEYEVLKGLFFFFFFPLGEFELGDEESSLKEWDWRVTSDGIHERGYEALIVEGFGRGVCGVSWVGRGGFWGWEREIL